METKSNKARDFAIKAHGDQKYGKDSPYVVHLDDVALLFCQEGYLGGSIQDAAFLHDVLEDCPGYTREILAEEFGEDVAKIVEFCTDEPGHNRKTRKAATYAKMRATIDLYLASSHLPSWLQDAIRVKIADRVSNIASCFHGFRPDLWEMYRRERDTFGKALYVKGLCEGLWDQYDALLEKPPVDLDKAVRQQGQVTGFAKAYGGSEVSTLTADDAVSDENEKSVLGSP